MRTEITNWMMTIIRTPDVRYIKMLGMLLVTKKGNVLEEEPHSVSSV